MEFFTETLKSKILLTVIEKTFLLVFLLCEVMNYEYEDFVETPN